MPYIYKITNTINNKVYIGKTSLTIQERFKEHCKDSNKFFNRPLYAAMRKYGIENFSVEEVEYCINDEIASKREQYWIEYFHSYHYGYNATMGGDGRRIYDYEAIYHHWLTTKNCAETAKQLQIDVETVSKAVKEFGEIPYCKKGFVKPSQAVDRLTLNGEYIDSFSSIREALRYLLPQLGKNIKNISGYSSHIGQVCKGTRKTCLGYKWRYSNFKD